MSTTMHLPTKADHPIITTLQSSKMAEQFAAVLPKACPPERFVRFAVTQLRKTPKLAHCSQESVLKCFMECAELGIEPDGRRAHIIPYKEEATLIIDYKGLVELILRSGKVKAIRAEAVCEADHFTWRNGVLEHQVHWRQPRGEAQCYYAEATLSDGTTQSAVMTREDCEKIRGRSRAGKSGPWVTDFDEMAKKTTVRRLSKMLPLSAEVAHHLSMDGDALRPVMQPELSQPLFTGPQPVEQLATAEVQPAENPFWDDGFDNVMEPKEGVEVEA